jgi:hypothetical protein
MVLGARFMAPVHLLPEEVLPDRRVLQCPRGPVLLPGTLGLEGPSPELARLVHRHALERVPDSERNTVNEAATAI